MENMTHEVKKESVMESCIISLQDAILHLRDNTMRYRSILNKLRSMDLNSELEVSEKGSIKESSVEDDPGHLSRFERLNHQLQIQNNFNSEIISELERLV